MNTIWKKDFNIDDINRFAENSIVGHLGIKFVEKGENFIKATMPVDPRTIQPLGILHGGASAVLAETLGSMASHLTLDDSHYSVGLEIKANHIRSIKKGIVTGKVEPVHLGKTTQIWDISIRNEQATQICVSRLTLVVMEGSLL